MIPLTQSEVKPVQNVNRRLSGGIGDMADEEFAKRFAIACKEAGFGNQQNEIAKSLGITTVMSWNYIHGEKLPAMKTAVALATRLGVCVEWLLTGRGPMRPAENREILDITDLSPSSKAIIKELRQALASK